MALKGIIRSLKFVLGDVGGDVLLIGYVDEDSEYIVIENLGYDSFGLNGSSSKIEINRDVLLENTGGTTMTITKLAIIENVSLTGITDITASGHEIFPEQAVNIEITPGQIVNFKGATLEIS